MTMKKPDIKYVKKLDRNGDTRLIDLPAHIPKDRTCHLIDVENLMSGTSAKERNLLRKVLCDYEHVEWLGATDAVFVAVNPGLYGWLHKGLLLMGFYHQKWRTAKVLTGPGKDGADHELLKVVKDHKWVLENFGRVVIGSGDGIFAEVAECFVGYGLDVVVVSRRESVSKKLLAVNGCVIRYLP